VVIRLLARVPAVRCRRRSCAPRHTRLPALPRAP